MRVTISGVKKSKTKNGKDCFQYYGTKEFTAYEQENTECTGFAVVSEFSYENFNLSPGDVVEFEYEPGFEGRATLTGVRPIKLSTPFEDGKAPDKQNNKK